MLTTRRSHTTLIALAALIAPAAAAAALAGPLTPPAGPVAPTMKTLEQVEPRIAIGPQTTPGTADALYLIAQPGNYYLTGDVVGVPGKHGIQIDADDVVIDLNGFTVRGVPGARCGVADRASDELPSTRNITVANGTVHSWPQTGVALDYTYGGRITGVLARNNNSGIMAGANFVIRDCVARNNTHFGISGGHEGVITECAASSNQYGIHAEAGSTVENCIAARNSHYGFDVSSSVIRGCTAESNPQIGINAYRSRVESCHVLHSPTGILAQLNTVVEACSIDTSSACGIRVTAPRCRIAGNTITSSGGSSAPNAAIYVAPGIHSTVIDGNSGTGNARGVYVDGTNNLIIRNNFGRPVNNHVNYFIAPGNRIAPIVVAGTNAGNVSSSSSYAGSFSTSDPNANISH